MPPIPWHGGPIPYIFIRNSFKAEDPTSSILETYNVTYEKVSREYLTLLKNSGESPRMSMYDDDEDEAEEFGAMRKPKGNISTVKAKHRPWIILVEILLPLLRKEG
ncbi:hypothetical protein BPO_1684 [Bergeyella porcorum]|uniref:Uncharacterized protein n=1 Tax=Bergeyella porcorum TaxID=1735111 RepID=A0AAU0F3P7_9FLAO